MKQHRLLLIFLLLIGLGACQPAVPLSPDLVQTPENPTGTVVIPTPSPTSVSMATFTCTPNPTVTPAPASSPTPTPTQPIDQRSSLEGHTVLYTVDGSLKSLPAWPVFDHPEMKTIYKSETDQGDSIVMFLIGNAPVSSPDGRWMIVNSLFPPPPQRGSTWLADLAGGALTLLSSPQIWPTWSPDSSQIAYVLGSDLYTLDVTQEYSPTVIMQQEGLLSLFARWSPTGEWIAVASDEPSQDTTSSERMYTYWLVSPTGDEVRSLGTFPTGARQYAPQNLEWSPDGSQVATPSGIILGTDGQATAFSDVSADSLTWTPWGVARSLVEHQVDIYTWATLGQRTAYGVRNTQDGSKSEIYIWDHLSKAYSLIAQIPDCLVVNLAWSTDGKWLVVGSQVEAKADSGNFLGGIYAIDLESENTLVQLIEGKDVYLVGVIPETGE